MKAREEAERKQVGEQLQQQQDQQEQQDQQDQQAQHEQQRLPILGPAPTRLRPMCPRLRRSTPGGTRTVRRVFSPSSLRAFLTVKCRDELVQRVCRGWPRRRVACPGTAG